MSVDVEHWQHRLDTLRAACHVPGAGLAVLADGEVHELASGVLHRGTGVAATPGSVFLSGSLAKAYTASAVLRLVDDGAVGLDTPVHTVVPEFTGDPAITVRMLLSHTGGLTCDFTYDSGRGDDCVARYVSAANAVAPDCPPGIALSYSSVGYAVLGRLVEVLTDTTWDAALARLLFEPLGLTHSMTLPEEALRFRAAMGHLGLPGEEPDPAPVWDLMPRSAGPYGRIVVSAGDVVRFARMHLDGGLAADGTRVLSEASVTAMRTPVAETVDEWTFHAGAWGLGWALYDWDGVAGFGHDGSAVSQQSFLRAVPGAGVAVALLANGGDMARLYHGLFGELLGELAGVATPPPFAPPAAPPTVDVTGLLGSYRREGVLITILPTGDGARMRWELVDGMAGFADPVESDLVPVAATASRTVFAATGEAFGADPIPVVFTDLPDGRRYVFVGLRATPRVSPG